MFVVKLDAITKQIDFIDFWGGSVYDTPWSIAVDSEENAWVVGGTLSSDIPLSGAILSQPALLSYQETYGFVARFAPNGSLTYSTYTAPGVLYGVAVNATGAAWVVGSTICYNIGSDATNPALNEFQPTSDAAQGACSATPVEINETGYMMRLAPTGSVQYATFYVPASGSGRTNGISDVAVDPLSNAYIAGTMAGYHTVERAVYNGASASYVSAPEANLACEVTKFDSSGRIL